MVWSRHKRDRPGKQAMFPHRRALPVRQDVVQQVSLGCKLMSSSCPSIHGQAPLRTAAESQATRPQSDFQA